MEQSKQQTQDQFGCALRLVAGAVLMVGAFFVHGPWVLIAVPGVAVYLAGALRYCPTFMPVDDEPHGENHPAKG